MSRYDFIRFGGFVNWADEDTDTFRKMKVCLPVKEPSFTKAASRSLKGITSS